MLSNIEHSESELSSGGAFCNPAFTITATDKSYKWAGKIFSGYTLTSNRNDFRSSRYNALCSILVAINMGEDQIFYVAHNKNAYTVNEWPIKYKPMMDVLKWLEDQGWVIRYKQGYINEDLLGGTVNFVRTQIRTDRYYAPQGSPLISYEKVVATKLSYRKPEVLIKFPNSKGDLNKAPIDIEFMSIPKNKRFIEKYLKPRVVELNEYASLHSYKDGEGRNLDIHWTRIFKGSWGTNSYGRIYSTYQSVYKGEDRLNFIIDNEPVVEIDVHASALHIFSMYPNSEVSFDLPDVDDFYDLINYKNKNRKLTKQVINAGLNGANILGRRFPVSIREHEDPDVRALIEGVKWKDVKAAIFNTYPKLKLAKEMDIAGYIQFKDSDVIMKTMLKLFEQGIGCLSVHDCVMVPQSREAEAEKIFSDVFVKDIGIKPRLHKSYP